MALSPEKVMDYLNEEFTYDDYLVLNNEISERERLGGEVWHMCDLPEIIRAYKWNNDVDEMIHDIIMMACHGKFDAGHDFFKVDAYKHLVSSNDIFTLLCVTKEEMVDYLVEHEDVARAYIDIYECEEDNEEDDE